MKGKRLTYRFNFFLRFDAIFVKNFLLLSLGNRLRKDSATG